MFYYLSGELAYRDANTCVIDCGGVGYKLTVSVLTAQALAAKDGAKVKLFTHLAVREDGIELFGFLTNEEKECFNLLIGINGVGPKAAINILSVLSPEKLTLAICTDDIKAIAKAQNVGSKTAARIVLELKDKISKDAMSVTTGTVSPIVQAPIKNSALSEAAEALTTLGFDKNSALKALSGVDPTLSVGAMIEAALKKIGR